MEFFPDRGHVRLRSRENGLYLHADEDGWGVSWSPHRASVNTAWAVHLLPQPILQGAAANVLLHSAAYGRYLGLSIEWLPQEQGDPAVEFIRMVQLHYDAPLQTNVMWEVLGVEEEDGNGGVFLRCLADDNNFFNDSPWTVEAIPPRLAPPPLPDQIPNGVAAPPVVLRRLIRYNRADNNGIFISHRWETLEFNGRSLLDLIANLTDDEAGYQFNNITLCVRGGFLGRITPLVINLPLSEEAMDIVVLTTGSAAATELRHPNVDAP